MIKQTGMALLLVLWVLALLSMMLAGALLLLRNNVNQSRWQDHELQAELAAESGIHMAILDTYRPLPSHRWRAVGDTQVLHMDGAIVAVTVQSVRGLLDLNSVGADAMGRLLAACHGSGVALQALLSTRKKSPFLLNRQLLELPSITPSTFACMAPYVTVWSGLPQPDLAFAPASLAAILSLPAAQPAMVEPGKVLRVRSSATLPGGFHHVVTATLVIQNTRPGHRPYRVMDWHD